MSAYYNEIDPFAAQWLRNLIAAGHIAPGDVDERSIADVHVSDILGYTQHHFFAGIGGWSLALRMAGWPDDHEVWTGSCPCQPFSVTGKRKGVEDERHLWPVWHRLIGDYRPATVFGEQVASKDGLGWLGAVQADLETSGYTTGAADLCAAGIGAPHVRQRLWFVARGLGHSNGQHTRGDTRTGVSTEGQVRQLRSECDYASSSGAASRFSKPGSQERPESRSTPWGGSAQWGGCVYTACRDGKARPVKPGIQPLVDGVPGRVGRLRGYGNAIVPQVAAEFVGAYMDL